MVISSKQPHITCFNARVDEDLQVALFKHLKSLHITLFCRDDIKGGSNWKAEVEQNLSRADIILLLISSDFLADYEEEIRQSISIHYIKQTTIIPILLRSVLLEDDSILGNFKALPSNGKAVVNWDKLDNAFVNIAECLQKIITDLVNKREEEIELEEENETSFNTQNRIALFDYLTTEHHVDIHRIIMRFITQQSQNLGNQTTEQEIFREIREKRTAPSSQEEIRNSLTFLEERENLTKIRNFADADTVFAESQQLPRDFVYSITPWAKDVEILLDRWRSNKTRRGSLDQYNLLKIKENLERLHKWLTSDFTVTNDSLIHSIAETWKSLFQDWQNLETEVPLYLSTLEKDAEKDRSLPENYQQYKYKVVNYIKRFVNTLKEVTPCISDIFVEWNSKVEPKEHLVISIIKHHEQNSGYDENTQRIARSLRHSTYQEINKVENWFQEQEPKFYYHASVAIQRLVAWADRISRQQQLKNTTYLQDLAMLYLHIKEFETAEQIFSIVFAQALPFHQSSSTLVNTGITDKTEMESVWLIPAPYQPAIPIYVPISKNTPKSQQRSFNREQESKRMRDQSTQQIEVLKNNRKLLLSLIPLDLGTLTQVNLSFCHLLEDIIDKCQFNENNQYDEMEDQIIILDNPDEQVYIHICTNEGFFYVPRYCFSYFHG